MIFCAISVIRNPYNSMIITIPQLQITIDKSHQQPYILFCTHLGDTNPHKSSKAEHSIFRNLITNAEQK